MQNVKFTKRWNIYNAGDVAAFAPHQAEALVKEGVGKVEPSSRAEQLRRAAEPKVGQVDMLKK